MTSHAAVVARGMGKPCVAGVQEMKIDESAGSSPSASKVIKVGDVDHIDGATGRVIVGQAKLVAAGLNENVNTILGWADELRRLKVRTNADTPEDAAKRASSALRASASAVPSTCSCRRSGCRSCRR